MHRDVEEIEEKRLMYPSPGVTGGKEEVTCSRGEW